MKLNFRLDLNTIVLLLLIVVFSVILYYNVKKHTIIEGVGEPSSIQEANENLKNADTTLAGYIADKKSFDDAFLKLTGQTTVVTNESGYITATAAQIPQNPITPNLHVMDAQLTASRAVESGYNTTVDTIKAKYNLTGTANIAFSSAIQTMIDSQTSVRNNAKIALDNLIKFTIKEPVASADRSVVITIENSSAIPPTYTITSIPPVMDMLYTSDANPPTGNVIATVTGLTNNTSYIFKVVADYGSDIKYEVTTTTPVVPRGKPSVTAVGFTGYANITIVPPSDGLVPRDYTISSDATVPGLPVTQSTLIKRIDGLTNNTPYTFSVVANYSGGSSLPATTTVTPRNAPTGTVARGNKSAIVTVIPPTGNTTLTPISYLVSGYKSLQSTSTLPMQQFPDSTATATFSGLSNGTQYTFNIIAIYPDESRSSPSLPLTVTPYDAPKPSASVSPIDSGAELRITKPTTTETVTGYEVKAYKKGTSVSVGSVPSSITSIAGPVTIAGLINNTTYTISVIAKYSFYNSDKFEIDVTPIRVDPVIKTTITEVNISFYIDNPTSTMEYFTVKQLDGSARKGDTVKSKNMTDVLSLGPYLTNTTYTFDISVKYKDTTTPFVKKSVKYKTLPAPVIDAVKTKTDIKIYVVKPDLTTMSSFFIVQQDGAAKGQKKTSTSMSDKLSLGPYRSNVEYEFDVTITYKDGKTYKKDNAKFRTTT